uniref:Uncharacterized protein n=1 Tax=Plectus sambesii TaxID=2011161 RepID=A0A914VD58_9BILA
MHFVSGADVCVGELAAIETSGIEVGGRPRPPFHRPRPRLPAKSVSWSIRDDGERRRRQPTTGDNQRQARAGRSRRSRRAIGRIIRRDAHGDAYMCPCPPMSPCADVPMCPSEARQCCSCLRSGSR